MNRDSFKLSPKMMCRTIFVFSLAIVLVQADLDQDGLAQAMSTDQDSTSDEVPTESMNSISSDQPNDGPQYYNGGAADTSSTSSEAHHYSNGVTGGTDGSKSSVEDQDDDQSPNSEEGKR